MRASAEYRLASARNLLRRFHLHSQGITPEIDLYRRAG
jgi:xanthine dehydrogenase iron-sulfur cluster and FAD-binding subunit A